MSKEKKEVKKETLQLRLSKKTKDSLKASAFRQNTTLSELIFSNLDTMKVKGIKEGMLTILENLKNIDGIDLPKADLKMGSDGNKTDIQVMANLVELMVGATDELNPQNKGLKGAIRKANGDFKPQQLDSHTSILRSIKRNGKATKD